MKHLKVKWSFFALLTISVLFGQAVSLINYFSALVLHELAHVFVALKKGYKLKVLKIDMFGMSCELDETIDDRDSFSINIAGPIFNLFLCICCLAIYWLIPTSYIYINKFCFSNLILAIFNLIPVYPLDGSKIFKNMFNKEKTYKIVDFVLRLIFSVLFLVLFICSIFHKTNYLFLLISIFFVLSKPQFQTSLTLFKSKTKKFEVVKMLKISSNVRLIDLLKKITNKHYTIFYCSNLNKYISETEIINLSTKFSLFKTIEELKKLNN